VKLIKKGFFSLFLFTVLLAKGGSQPPVIHLTDTTRYITIGKEMVLLEDASRTLTFDSVRKIESQFILSKKEAPNYGTTQSAIWGIIDVNLHTRKEMLLEIDAPWLDSFIVYYPANGRYLTSMLGRRIPLKGQERNTPDILYKLSWEDFPTDTVLRFYFRANGRVVVLPSYIGEVEWVMKKQFYKSLFYMFYTGIVFMLVVFYLAVFITSRKRENLYYILWIITTTYYFAATKGFLKLALPDSLQFLIYHTVEPISVAGFMLLLFTSNSLHIKTVIPSFLKWFRLMQGLMILLFLFCFIGLNQLALKVFEPLMIVAMCMNLVAGIMVYRKGNGYALYYTLAFAQTLVSVGVYILVFMRVLDFNDYTSNASLIGTLIETVMLSLGLGAKIRSTERDKLRAQAEALFASRENEKIIMQQNEILEVRVNERTRLLEEEKKKSDDLLRNILPEETARELKQIGHSRPKTHEMVSVMFTDFVDFTRISEKMSAEKLVAEIDHCFSAFDLILEKYNVEKIKTIGDSYMCVSGLPTPNPDHAEEIIKVAFEIRDFMKRFKDQKISKGHIPFEIRIGVNSGPVVAGVVGAKKFAYDIWGDTVNTASRMEENSEAGKINVSGQTYALVKDKFKCTYRGKIPAKNKGEVDMYFVE
jgi:class 3 adenylate cyclase